MGCVSRNVGGAGFVDVAEMQGSSRRNSSIRMHTDKKGKRLSFWCFKPQGETLGDPSQTH